MKKETLIKMQAIANNIATQVNELRSMEEYMMQDDADDYCQALCALITAYDSTMSIIKERKGGKPNE